MRLRPKLKLRWTHKQREIDQERLKLTDRQICRFTDRDIKHTEIKIEIEISIKIKIKIEIRIEIKIKIKVKVKIERYRD